jgi:hypothetical protein
VEVVTYTQLSVLAVILVLLIDVAVLRTALIRRKVFWVSYAIIITFQFITNGLFTGLQIVKYRDFAIIGSDSPTDSAPPFIGDGRLFFAPIEDLGFGFSLVLLSMSLWVFFQLRTSDKATNAGPPRTNLFSRL